MLRVLPQLFFGIHLKILGNQKMLSGPLVYYLKWDCVWMSWEMLCGLPFLLCSPITFGSYLPGLWMKGDTLPRNALLESPTSVSLIKKLILFASVGYWIESDDESWRWAQESRSGRFHPLWIIISFPQNRNCCRNPSVYSLSIFNL